MDAVCRKNRWWHRVGEMQNSPFDFRTALYFVHVLRTRALAQNKDFQMNEGSVDVDSEKTIEAKLWRSLWYHYETAMDFCFPAWEVVKDVLVSSWFRRMC